MVVIEDCELLIRECICASVRLSIIHQIFSLAYDWTKHIT